MSNKDQILDVLCVGFGPTALSLAAGLHEQNTPDQILFLERNPSFFWQGENFPLDKNQMRTNFMQDLVTERNPSSKFSFLNYLWSNNLLVIFTNLSSIKPPRRLFRDYLVWCARKFENLGWVNYGVVVESISPISGGDSSITAWRVVTKHASGKVRNYFTRKVILATGNHAFLPNWATKHSFGGKLVHSVKFGKTLDSLKGEGEKCLNIGIIGNDNEAVEIFNYCQELSTVRTTSFLDASITTGRERSLCVFICFNGPNSTNIRLDVQTLHRTPTIPKLNLRDQWKNPPLMISSAGVMVN
jgi:L-ornithine N5-oxygenase